MNSVLKLPEFAQTSPCPERASLLFGGDFCPIGRYEEKILAKEEIFDDALKEFFKNSFSMINLEAPLCEKNLPSDNPSGIGLRATRFTAEYLKELDIDAVGIANNHIRDFKDEGVAQTIQTLEDFGILHCGAGMNLREAQKPLAVNINGIKLGIWALAEKELNVASENSAGSSWFRPEKDAARIKKFKYDFDFFIVYLHAGHEFISTPSPRIRESCRAFVDAGANAVIAHHPHVMQGVEKYKSALIAYSLGNLVFDSAYVSAYENTNRGYMVNLNISKNCITEAVIVPYKLRDNIAATSLSKSELDEFGKDFNRLSENITDNLKFCDEWEQNVKFRWESEFKSVLRDFSKNFNDVENKDYARRGRNLFSCPTHIEMIEKIFLMLEEGKISRLE